MAADARRVDPDYSQEADCLILEYLLHNATNALLEAYEGDLSFFSPKHGPRKRKWPELRKDSAGDVETHLMMVDCTRRLLCSNLGFKRTGWTRIG